MCDCDMFSQKRQAQALQRNDLLYIVSDCGWVRVIVLVLRLLMVGVWGNLAGDINDGFRWPINPQSSAQGVWRARVPTLC